MQFSAKIWTDRYTASIEVRGTEEWLELTADGGDEETTVTLDPAGVHKLWLALGRYERANNKIRQGAK